MALKIGKREKIVAFGIAGLVGILLVHILVFSGKTKRFLDADYALISLENEMRGLRQPRGRQQLDLYREQSGKLRERFAKVVDGFGVFIPDFWSDYSGKPEVRQAQWADLLAILDRLRALRQQGKEQSHTALNFLAEGIYTWNFPADLPKLVRDKKANLYDILNNLHGNYKSVLASEGSSEAFRAAQLLNYAQTLFQLDANYYWERPAQIPKGFFSSLFDIWQICGPPVPYLKVVEHVRIYEANKPEDLKGELATREKLLEIMGLNDTTGIAEVPLLTDVLYPGPLPAQPGARGNLVEVNVNIKWEHFAYYRQQLAALIDLIERADRAGVASIDFVKLREIKAVGPVHLAEEAAPTPAPAVPTPGGWDEGQGGSTFATPAPVLSGAPVAISIPIEMVIRGSNQSTTTFLYDLTHAHRPYELDALQIRGEFNQAQPAVLTVSMTINVIAWIVGVEKNF